MTNEIKIQSTCYPDEPAKFRAKFITVGDMKRGWTNFNENLYFRISVIRSIENPVNIIKNN